MIIVLAGGVLVLALAALAQAVRIGIKRGDWSGLIPVVVIALALFLTVAIALFGPVGD